MKSVSQKDVTKKLHIHLEQQKHTVNKSCKFHLLQSCFKPGRWYCWMDKMLHKLGCFTVKEWNSCELVWHILFTLKVHQEIQVALCCCFSTQLFFETQKSLADWLTNFPLVPGNLAGKSYLILSGEFVYYHEKGKARHRGRRWSPKATRKVQIIGA